MKKFCFSCCSLLLGTLICFAQSEDPVKWSFSATKINAATYELHATATIEKGWHIYSQSTPEGGPIKTTINFTKNPLVTLQGDIRENGKMEKHFEKIFGVEVYQFSNKVDFVQVVKLKTGVKTNVSGSVEFMICNDEECMPPKKQPFSISLK